jgi:hypothetical protein
MSALTIDFLKPRAMSWLGWCVLAVGIGSVAAALNFDHQRTRERAEHEAAMNARASAAEQQRREASRPMPVSPDQHRLQHIAPQLRQPWLPVLRVVEGATRPPVYLLALAIDPASGNVRVEGEAPSFDKALEYAKALDEEGLLGPAELRSHEQMSDPSGRTAVRFTIKTRWSAR